MWADDDNAMTRAEAQAFKRACSCFGLGRYFYEFAEMWVDLNDYGQPIKLPTLSETEKQFIVRGRHKQPVQSVRPPTPKKSRKPKAK